MGNETAKKEDKERMWFKRVGGDHSASVIIPSLVMSAMGLKRGDTVVITYKAGDKEFRVEKFEDNLKDVRAKTSK